MLTREQVSEMYTLNENGTVTNPGKFEREPWYVVALWDAALDGCADRSVMDGDTELSCFAHDDEIATMLGVDVNPDKFACVWERSDGFVFLDTMLGVQLDALESSDDDSEGL